MNSISQKISAGGATLLLALMFTATAGAADRTATASDIAVKYSGEQLGNEADAQALYKKLRSAARAVCDDNAGGHRTLEVRNRTEKCVNQVLADAVRKIDQPLLTTVHESKGKKSSEVG
jgi:UrcA family protein